MAAKEKVDKKLAKKIAEKKTPAGKLRDLSVAEIKTKIAELKQELFNLRFQAEVGKLENTAQLKKVKKEIARCYTVLTERENTKRWKEIVVKFTLVQSFLRRMIKQSQ